MDEQQRRALSGLLDFLIATGWISRREAILGDFRALMRVSRNRVYAVHRRHGPALIVKMATAPDAIETLHNECLLYRTVYTVESLSQLRRWIPEYFDAEYRSGVFAVRLLPDGRNLAEIGRELGAVPTSSVEDVGSALGTVRRITWNLADRRDVLSTFLTSRKPWILSLHTASFSVDQRHGAGPARVAQWVRDNSRLCAALRRADDLWRPDALVHGDMKLQNCISVAKAPESVLLIDWGMAQAGDGLWDASSFVQSLVTNAAVAEADVPGLVRARESLRPSIERFWSAYFEAAHVQGHDLRDRERRQAAVFGICRAIQTAYEVSQSGSEIHPHALALLKLGNTEAEGALLGAVA